MNDTDNFDGLMKAALCEIVREDWDALVNDGGGETVTVSRGMGRRIARILAGEKPKKRRGGLWGKLAVALLAALSVLAMLGMAMRPVREAFVHTVVTWYGSHFGVRYEAADEALPAVIEEVVLPAWLPDGWSLETNFATDYLVSHTILDANRNRITVDQHIIKPDEEMDRIDGRSPDAEVEDLLLNGVTPAKLIRYSDIGAGERLALMWTDGYAFLLKTNGQHADADTLIRIAESMERGRK